ncbi:MAG: hypothetical protein DRP89_07020 [Candidatus Neomarinimicrobiota bacterium]|nr:MAG: hypothetical protein DRP89_07020 [Candidatus Neomarinimicrobiota bacterium]
MRDKALQVIKNESNQRLARNKLREYLQHVILRRLFEQNLLNRLIFHGGTALRILHQINRFSEDLDFHLEYQNSKSITIKELDSLKQGLELAGYQISLKKQVEKTVKSVFIKFERLLYDARLSPNKSEKLNVKIEVDTNPPEGFQTETTLVNKYFPFAARHHDLSTFFSGKLHAILCRSYPKGRDLYDLAFYLSHWQDIQPNFTYLNNAIQQTDSNQPQLTENNWREFVKNKVESLSWNLIKEDVEPFIENELDFILLQKEHLLNLLKK